MRRPHTFLNTILGVVIAAGCSSESTGPTEPGMSPAFGLANLTIARCPSPSQANVSAKIGSAGGTLVIGSHSLVIPPGALSKDVVITAKTGGSAGNAIEFGPAGLRFNTYARLNVSVANCTGWGLLRLPMIVFTDALLKILELEPSVLDNRNKIVVGWIWHFSRYAVAY